MTIFDALLPTPKARKRTSKKDGALARQLKNKRIERGLTQEELAKEAEVGVAQIRKLEQGMTNVQLATLMRLAKTLRTEFTIGGA